MFQPSMFDTHNELLDMGESHRSQESDLGKIRVEEEFESSRSATENLEGISGEEQDPNRRPKRKRYHRHTQHQIEELEAFFKECPHPDDKQRKELSQRVGLLPLQIKFWFQNKRTQIKFQHERSENQILKAENDRPRAENMRFKDALSSAACGGPAAIGEKSFDEQHLRIESARLREEIDRVSTIAAKYVGKPLAGYPHLMPPSTSLDPGLRRFGPQLGLDMYAGSAGDILRPVTGLNEADMPMVMELAVSAMEELTRMVQARDPLWVSSPDGSTEMLSDEEYFRTFVGGIGPTPLGLRSEASRDQAVVIVNHMNLVEILMDVNQWSHIFTGIVSRAMTQEVLSTGVAGNYNGALHVMAAEFQVPSPLVPTREYYFIRYCKQHIDGTWAVVDVSLDNLNPSPINRCRRRPSGCLIQELPNGYSKVTWVEHVEVDDSAVHNVYRALVSSGMGFGAKHWVATLERQCERLASAMASNIPSGEAGVITSSEGRRSMLKLAERMVLSFCSGVGASTANTWTTLSGSEADDVRIMTRRSVDDPGRPPGIVLCASTSFWMPISPKRAFDFLRDESSRCHWDILSTGGLVQEMAHIASGRDPGNYVSLLRVNSANSSQSNMLILQESCIDATGSYVVYAPVDISAMNVVLNGGDPDYVALLPSGFAILPDGPPAGGPSGILDVGSGGGSLLTVAFQILVDSIPTAKLSLGSVATVNNLIKCTVEKIKMSPQSASAMNVVLNGGDPDYVALLPSGFAILPDGPPAGGPPGIIDVGSGGGSLLTVAFQILVDSIPTAKLSLGSVATVNNLIKPTVEKIKMSPQSTSRSKVLNILLLFVFMLMILFTWEILTCTSMV